MSPLIKLLDDSARYKAQLRKPGLEPGSMCSTLMPILVGLYFGDKPKQKPYVMTGIKQELHMTDLILVFTYWPYVHVN